MKVVLLGTGTPRPDGIRGSASNLVVVNDEPFIFDCGGGFVMRLKAAGFNPDQVNNIFLTHLHVDHVNGFPEFVKSAWISGKKNELNLYGPIGVKKFADVALNDLYPYLKSFISKAKGVEIKVNVKESEGGLIAESDNWKVTAVPTSHGTLETSVKCLVYKIESEGKSVVFSGDTSKSETLIKLAQGADVLVHEILDNTYSKEAAVKFGHTLPIELGEVAAEANVKKLVYNHIFPESDGKDSELIELIKKNYSGEIIPGKDLLSIEV